MIHNNKPDRIKDLFAKLPKPARLRKTGLISLIVLAAMLLLIIVYYLPTNATEGTPDDTLESESESTHWLTANAGVNKASLNDKYKDTSNIGTADPKQDTSDPDALTIKKSQQEQLASALEEINAKSAQKGEIAENVDSIQAANSAPIQIAINPVNTPKEISENQPLHEVSSSNNTLPSGTIIPISLVTEVNSELSGYVIAQVSRNIADQAQQILIPQGTKILLQYESADGDVGRLSLKAISMSLSSQKTISLDGAPVIDVQGRSGIKDQSNHHTVRNIISTISQVATSQAGQIIASKIPGEESKSLDMLAPITSNNIYSQRPTTFFIRAGYECNLLLIHDLAIPLN